jgi:arylsulfatase
MPRPFEARGCLRPGRRHLAAALLLLLAACGAGERAAPKRLILVTFDTLRADHLGCYGYERDTTPNLDRFATGALRMERAYTAAASTAPALASLMTSRYPHQHGVLRTYGYALPAREVTLAERMTAAGYTTGAVVGIGVLAPDRQLDQGFGSYAHTRYTNQQYWKTAAEVTDEAIAWLTQHHESPFFLWVHYFEPHDPHHIVPAADRERFRKEPTDHPALRGLDPDSHEYRGLKGRIDDYDGALFHADAEFGRLLAEIDRLGLRADAMVVVTADHGEMLGEGGQQGHTLGVWEPVIRVPLLIQLPGLAPGVATRTGRLIDLTPTIVREFSLPLDGSPFEGRPLALDREQHANDDDEPPEAFADTWFGATETGSMRVTSLVRGRWKLVVSQHVGAEATSRLFDLEREGDEARDVRAEHPHVAAGLESRVTTWMREGFGRPQSIVQDATEIEMLRALGYVE